MTKEPKKNKRAQRGLGRGLSTLLGDAEARTALEELPIKQQIVEVTKNVYDNKSIPLNTSSLKNIPIEWISPGSWQPRRNFDTKSLKELADSFLNQGIIQPILVCPSPGEKNKYKLVAGERRWRAAQIAKIYEIPSIVREFSSQEAAEIALVENIQRRDLSSIEEALAYQKLIQNFKYTQQELSSVIGKSRPYIANLLRLLTLPEWIQTEIENGSVSIGQIRPIIGLDGVDELAKLIIQHRLTAREAEKLVNSQQKISKLTKPKNSKKDIENRELEEKIEEKLGLRVGISWNPKTEKGSIKLSVSSLEQFDMLLKKLEIQTR